jgi:hypothetical protein
VLVWGTAAKAGGNAGAPSCRRKSSDNLKALARTGKIDFFIFFIFFFESAGMAGVKA